MITNFKIFEGLKPKFKIGDYVRIHEEKNIEGGWKSKPYKIKKIKYVNRSFLYTLKYVDDDRPMLYRYEESLELIPEYEIYANKYNL